MKRFFSKEWFFNQPSHHCFNDVRNASWMYVFIFISVVICSSGQTAGAATAGALDDGITAFRGGDFVRASSIMRARAEDSTAQAYLLAMQENIKCPPPSSVLITFIASNAASNDDFTVLTGELHLAGLISGANPKTGEQMLKRLAVVNEYPFAIYALGELYEGRFGQRPDIKTAEIWYRQVKSKFAAAEQRLETLKADAKTKESAAVLVAGDGGSSLGRKFDTAKPKGDLEGGSVRTDRTKDSSKDRHRGETGGGAAAASTVHAPASVVAAITAASESPASAPMSLRPALPTVAETASVASTSASDRAGYGTGTAAGGHSGTTSQADAARPLLADTTGSGGTLPGTPFASEVNKGPCSDCCVIF